MSQIIILLSFDPEARIFPSEANETQETKLLCSYINFLKKNNRKYTSKLKSISEQKLEIPIFTIII